MFGDFSFTMLAVLIVVIVVSLTIHEMMHAFVGHRLGDDTAAEAGRISLNPLRHIDPLMTVILPIFTIIAFGVPLLAAKPVPFDPRNVKWDEFGAALIALAGPLSNLVLAVIGGLLLQVLPDGSLQLGSLGVYFLAVFVSVNVSLFVFNMIPIPPLDGSRVLYAFAPDGLRRVMEQLEPIGIFIVFGLIIAGGSVFVGRLVEMMINALQYLQLVPTGLF